MNSAINRRPTSRRVLLIDDRRDAVLMVRKLLELAGHQVATAEDGPSGLLLAREMHPDLILCDIGLPGTMSGFDVATAVRGDRALRSVYLVAVSGYGEPEHRLRAQQSGFDNYVVKPVGNTILKELVEQMPRFGDSDNSQ